MEEPEEIDDGDFEEQESEVDDTPVRIPKKSEILALAESMNHSYAYSMGRGDGGQYLHDLF
jgi:hypothetical protein